MGEQVEDPFAVTPADDDVLVGRVKLRVRVLVPLACVCAAAFAAWLMIQNNIYVPAIGILLATATFFIVVTGWSRLELRGTELRGLTTTRRVDLTRLATVSFTRTPPPDPRAPQPRAKRGASGSRMLWLVDQRGGRLGFVPARDRHGGAFVAAVAAAVTASGLAVDEPTRALLDRHAHDPALPASWAVPTPGSFGSPVVPGAPPPPVTPFFEPGRSDPASARMRFATIGMLVAAVALSVVPLATGAGPAVVHHFYCGPRQHLWTADADVPSVGVPPTGFAVAMIKEVDLAPLPKDDSVAADLLSNTSVSPPPTDVGASGWGSPDERIAVAVQGFADHATALRHNANAVSRRCNDGKTVARVPSVAGAVRVHCGCGLVQTSWVRGPYRVLVAFHVPQGTPSDARVAEVSKRINRELFGSDTRKPAAS